MYKIECLLYHWTPSIVGQHPSTVGLWNVTANTRHSGHTLYSMSSGFFFWTRFENLVAIRREINDRVVPILVAIRNWNDVICLSRSEKSLSLPSVLLLDV